MNLYRNSHLMQAVSGLDAFGILLFLIYVIGRTGLIMVVLNEYS